LKVKQTENFHLLDKEYEIWGLELDEILIISLVVFGGFFPLLFINFFLYLGAPLVWLFGLLLYKNRKSESNVRGRFVRELLEKLTGRRVWYV